MAVALIRIGDDVSVRLNGRELHVLPKRSECTLEELQAAFKAVEAAIDDYYEEQLEDQKQRGEW